MTGRSSHDCPSPTPATSPGSVLTFTFAGPKSYIASSHPHPIQEAKDANPNEARSIAVSNNIPSSLLECIESSVAQEQTASSPETTRYFTLKPGCFFLHITCWRPSTSDQEGEACVPFDECEEALWLVYSWTDRACHQWLPGRNPTHPQDIHPTFGRYVRDITNGPSGPIRGGIPNHFALGSTSETFFVRLSDDARNWHYRYHGLPEECNLAIQGSMAASRLYKEPRDRCPHNLQHCAFGRIRAVTLGQGGGWILYREEQPETLYGGRHLPQKLKEGLAYGRKRKLVINQAVLNPHHAREYVLAFNDGTVFYSFHQSFQEDFDRIAREWCGNRMEYKPRPDLLSDDDYPNVLFSDDSERESGEESSPSPSLRPEQPRLAAKPRRRPPAMVGTTRNHHQTPRGRDAPGDGDPRYNYFNQQPLGQAPPMAAPIAIAPGYGLGYAHLAPYIPIPAHFAPAPPWNNPYAGTWGGPGVFAPPTGPLQPPPSQPPRHLYDPYTGQALYSEMGDRSHRDADAEAVQQRSQTETGQSLEVRDSQARWQGAQASGMAGARRAKKGFRLRLRVPWMRRDEQAVRGQ